MSGTGRPCQPAGTHTLRAEPGLRTDPATAWPLADRLDLGALPSAVPCARLHTRAILAEWGLAHLNDTAELIVSELATNALQATRAAGLASPLIIHLHANEAYLRIGVWDALRQPPAQHVHDPVADHGRGLQIVAAISHDWGTYHPTRGGKIVYALISVTS